MNRSLILICFFLLTVKAERLLADEEPTANIELTDANFDELVTNSKDFWMVAFFAPWCPPCKKLLPEWKKTANVLEGKVKMGTVNCEEQKVAASKYPLRGYPTVYMFGADKTIPVYIYASCVKGLEKEALGLMKTLNEPVEITELTSPEIFQGVSSKLCFLAFLPEEGKDKNMETLQKAAARNRCFYDNLSYNYGWAAAGKQPELEKTLGVTNFPSLVALDNPHGEYGIFTGEWEVDPVSDFVKGREMTALSTNVQYEL